MFWYIIVRVITEQGPHLPLPAIADGAVIQRIDVGEGRIEVVIFRRFIMFGDDPIGHVAIFEQQLAAHRPAVEVQQLAAIIRSEEHTSELQSLMRISYAVFCLKKKIIISIQVFKTHKSW